MFKPFITTLCICILGLHYTESTPVDDTKVVNMLANHEDSIKMEALDSSAKIVYKDQTSKYAWSAIAEPEDEAHIIPPSRENNDVERSRWNEFRKSANYRTNADEIMKYRRAIDAAWETYKPPAEGLPPQLLLFDFYYSEYIKLKGLTEKSWFETADKNTGIDADITKAIEYIELLYPRTTIIFRDTAGMEFRLG
jgi:hypothetical protein